MTTPINILLVDDEPRNLEVLESILQAPDYRLVRAQTAEAALLELVQAEFACIVLDIQMPGMNGLELARLIKTRKRSQLIPIIFLTAYFQEDQDVLQGYGAGAVDYLTKPISPEVLRSKVSVFVELFRITRALASANHALQQEVAQREKAEEALRTANLDLEARVLERTADLSRTNSELRESEGRFRLLIEGAPNAMLMVDDRGRITTVNAQVEKLFGYAREELLGQSIERLVPARHRQGHPALRADYLRNPAPRPMGAGRELYGVRKNGAEVPIEIGLNPLRIGQQTFVVASIIDITERKHAEAALRESEERFRTMANAAPVMIWMSGTDKLCNYFNQRWLEFTGRPLEQELGHGWAEGMHPEDLPRCLKVYAESFDRRVAFEMDYRLRRADGEFRWINDQGLPRFTPNGTFVGYIGSCLDITQRREAEEVVRQARNLLEARVEQRTAELARANEELRAQMHQRRQLEALVLTISEREQQRIGQDLHDGLCQQLTGIKFRNRLLEQKLAERGVAEAADAHAIEALLSQAVEQARSQAHGLNPLRLEPDGLMAALHELASSIADVFGIECVCDSQDLVLLPDYAVAIHLYRIAQEAITNAIKHGKASKVRLELAELDDLVQLTIHDNGVGISSTPKQNAGMGLHIMSYRARTIGAVLDVQPAAHGGTLVTCSLPKPQLEPATQE